MINSVITHKYSLQKEIPEIRIITNIINHHHKVTKDNPKAALYPRVSNNLQRLHTLPTSHDPFPSLGRTDPIFTTKVNVQGYTTQPLQRLPWCITACQVSPIVQMQYTSPRRVTNKTKSNEPLHPPSWQSENHALVPIDSPQVKPTTPPGSSN